MYDVNAFPENDISHPPLMIHGLRIKLVGNTETTNFSDGTEEEIIEEKHHIFPFKTNSGQQEVPPWSNGLSVYPRKSQRSESQIPQLLWCSQGTGFRLARYQT